MKTIFNTYDENGYRRNINGNRSSRTEDNAIEYNLRVAWGNLVKDMTDSELVNAYDLFSVLADDNGVDYFGNNDERFPEFLRDAYPHLDRSYL